MRHAFHAGGRSPYGPQIAYLSHDTGTEDAVHAVRCDGDVRRNVRVQYEWRHPRNAGRPRWWRSDTLGGSNRSTNRSTNRNA